MRRAPPRVRCRRDPSVLPLCSRRSRLGPECSRRAKRADLPCGPQISTDRRGGHSRTYGGSPVRSFDLKSARIQCERKTVGTRTRDQRPPGRRHGTGDAVAPTGDTFDAGPAHDSSERSLPRASDPAAPSGARAECRRGASSARCEPIPRAPRARRPAAHPPAPLDVAGRRAAASDRGAPTGGSIGGLPELPRGLRGALHPATCGPRSDLHRTRALTDLLPRVRHALPPAHPPAAEAPPKLTVPPRIGVGFGGATVAVKLRRRPRPPDTPGCRTPGRPVPRARPRVPPASS
jgi:hypothetical protein